MHPPKPKPCYIIWNEPLKASASISMHTRRNIRDISTLNGSSLKLVDKFTHLGSSVSSTETDIDTWLAKTWTALNWLSVIWKSDLTNKIKRSFFQAAVVSILPYGCTTWTLTKRMKNKLNGNYTRMLRAILNKSWRQYPTKQQLNDHLPSITKPIKVRRTIHAGHCWSSRDELISNVLLWTPSQRQDDRLEHTYSSSVPIQDVALRTWRKQWTSKEQKCPCRMRDMNIYIYIYIYIFTNPSARTGYDTRSIFKWSWTGLNSEFSFSETKEDWRNQSALLFTYSWRENNWIHTFPRSISVMWKAISLVQDLNSCHRVNFLRR